MTRFFYPSSERWFSLSQAQQLSIFNGNISTEASPPGTCLRTRYTERKSMKEKAGFKPMNSWSQGVLSTAVLQLHCCCFNSDRPFSTEEQLRRKRSSSKILLSRTLNIFLYSSLPLFFDVEYLKCWSHNLCSFYGLVSGHWFFRKAVDFTFGQAF